MTAHTDAEARNKTQPSRPKRLTIMKVERRESSTRDEVKCRARNISKNV
jgi:hypothetical protein